MSIEAFPTIYPVDPKSDLVSLCPSKGVLFTGSYTRTGGESASSYNIQSTIPASAISTNYSSVTQQFDFKLNNQPPSYTYYFGFQTQRITSFPSDPTTTVLVEMIYLTIVSNNVIIGSLSAQIAYPDKGQGDISSTGQTEYPTFTRSGILSDVLFVKITFLPDLSRIVELIG